jgi:hypothetical protein
MGRRGHLVCDLINADDSQRLKRSLLLLIYFIQNPQNAKRPWITRIKVSECPQRLAPAVFTEMQRVVTGHGVNS